MYRPEFTTLQALFAATLLAGLAAAPIAIAADDDEKTEETRARLEEVERQLQESQKTREELSEKADATRIEIEGIARELVRRTAAVRSREREVQAVEERVAKLQGEEREAEDALSGERRKMATTLAALQRLGQRPPELLLARPGDAVETVQTATLLREALPHLRDQALAIRESIERLAELRQGLDVERGKLAQGLAALRAELDDLNKVKSRRERARRDYLMEADSETERMLRLAGEAQSLRSLLEQLARGSRPGSRGLSVPEGNDFLQAKGLLVMPATGNIGRRFGEDTAAGISQGISIRTRDGAQVVSPFDGRVVFSGPFRSYGQLLIIAHGGGYHTLLAGMDRIETPVGQWILAGEPIGVMGRKREVKGENSVRIVSPELYLELRRDNDPINPLPWFAAAQGKVGG